MSPHISILLPTHNRCVALAETLENFSRLKKPKCRVQFIVVDNASTDDTQAVLKRYSHVLDLELLYEESPGKNHALNSALTLESLGDLIVFTDDDVTPEENWLTAIHEASIRNPETSIFGGPIHIIWPASTVPDWAKQDYLSSWAFSKVDLGPDEIPWPRDQVPFGPNYWIRKDILGNHRFDTSLGPRPVNRIMGDETMFLRELMNEGNPARYVPSARIGHRIETSALTEKWIFNRALSMGRTSAHISPWQYKTLLDRFPLLWKLIRKVSLLRYLLATRLAFLSTSADTRVARTIRANLGVGANLEMLRLARSHRTSDTATIQE